MAFSKASPSIRTRWSVCRGAVAIASSLGLAALGCSSGDDGERVAQSRERLVSTTLTFEELPAGTIVTTQYQPRGVLFDNHFILGSPPTHSGTRTLHIAPTEDEFRFGPIVGTFTRPQLSVGLFAGAAFGSPQQGTLAVFGGDGQLIDQDGPKSIGIPLETPFLAGSEGDDITRFTFTTTGGRPTIDDLTFTALATPFTPLRGAHNANSINLARDVRNGKLADLAPWLRKSGLNTGLTPDNDKGLIGTLAPSGSSGISSIFGRRVLTISSSTGGNYGTTVPPTNACTGSFVDNLSFSYVHTAFDYAATPGDEVGDPCTQCGDCAEQQQGGVGQLPKLAIERIHQPRLADLVSSFGTGVFGNFDTKLRLATDSSGALVIDFHDVRSTSGALRFRELTPADGDNLVDGHYQDPTGQYRAIDLFDAAGARTSSQTLAATAVLTDHTGERMVFEVIRTDPSPSAATRDGRLLRDEDKNGNALVVSYVFPRTASDAQLSNNRLRLWQIQRVTDAYGVSASFEYGAQTVADRFALSKVTLPTGGVLQYSYDATRLTRIVYPDGSASTFSASVDPASQDIALAIDDKAAGQGRIKKTLFVSASTFTLPTGEVVSQTPNLIRRVVNGDGELVYRNWEDPSDPNLIYVFEGGGTLARFTLTAAGVPQAYARAAAPFDPERQEPTSATFEPVETYEWSAKSALTKRTDSLARSVRFVRDDRTRRVLSTTYKDGSTASAQYDALSSPLTATSNVGRRFNATFDARGNLLRYETGTGSSVQASWQATLNSKGQPTSGVDARGNTVNYVYDARGFLSQILEPADVSGDPRPTRRFTYDSAGRLETATDAAGRGQTYRYDPRGRLTAIVHADGSQELFEYGSGATAGLLTGKRDRNGIRELFSYDQTGRAIGRTLAADRQEAVTESWTFVPGTTLHATETTRGELVQFAYDARLRVVGVTRKPDGARLLVETHAYDAVDRLIRSTDAYGRSTHLVYDSGGRPVRAVHERLPGAVPEGANLATLVRPSGSNPAYVIEDHTYNVRGELLEMTDTRGVRVTRAYDARGRIVEEIQAAGTSAQSKRTFQYDSQGNVVRDVGPRTFTEGSEFATASTYTGRNLLRTVTSAAGRPEASTRSFTYTLTRQLATERDPRGGVTSHSYQACCDRLAETRDPLGFAKRFEHDAKGNRTAVTDENGIRSTFTYDGLDRLVTEVNGHGETTRHEYDDNLLDGQGLDARFPNLRAGLNLAAGADGSAELVTNPMGETSFRVADGLGRNVREIDGNGNTTTHRFDTVTNGLVERSTIDPTGQISRIRSDGDELERELLDPLGHRTLQSFDAGSNMVSVRDPNGVGIDCTFDPRNQAVSCRDTAGTTTLKSFDAEGNETTKTDGLGRVSSCSFDGLRRRTQCSDRLGAITRYAYDASSNQTSMTDAEGGVTTGEFDARNLLVRERFPDAGVRTTTYDPGRRVATRTPQDGQLRRFSYDGANRLLKRHYPDGRDDTFVYDAASRIKSAHSGRYDTLVTRSYDAGGRLTTEATQLAGQVFTTGFGYDAKNRITSVRYPDGTVSTRTYSARDELNEVKLGSQRIATRSHDAGRRLTSTTFGNGRVESREYRGDNLVTRIATPGTSVLDYQYNANQWKTGVTNATLSQESQTYGYDTEGRILDWTRGVSQDVRRWTLSPVGDFQRVVSNGVTETRVHNAVHETRQVNTVPLAYDARGNLTQTVSGRRYLWDFDNQLAEAPDVGTRYSYDAFGRRVVKQTGTTQRVFVHHGLEGEGQVLAEYVGGSLERINVYGVFIDELLAVRTGSTLHYFVSDNVQSVVAAMRADGSVAERYRYDAYGARTVLSAAGVPLTASTIGNQVGFTGRYHDAETGLVYFRARYYDPGLGRFVNRDIAYIEGPSLYRAYFVPNSVDPTGRGPQIGIRGEATVRYSICTGEARGLFKGEALAGYHVSGWGFSFFVGLKATVEHEFLKRKISDGVGCSSCAPCDCARKIGPAEVEVGIVTQVSANIGKLTGILPLECGLEFEYGPCEAEIELGCEVDLIAALTGGGGAVREALNAADAVGVSLKAGVKGGGKGTICRRPDTSLGLKDFEVFLGGFVKIGVGL